MSTIIKENLITILDSISLENKEQAEKYIDFVKINWQDNAGKYVVGRLQEALKMNDPMGLGAAVINGIDLLR